MPKWTRSDFSDSDSRGVDSRGVDSRGEGGESGRPQNIFSRKETKYELDVEAANDLRSVVASNLPSYEFKRGHSSTYTTTIYFDTDRLEFFERAARSYDDNLKIRVKEYYYRSGRDESGRNGASAFNCLTFPYCFVEIKQRENGLVMKRRMRLPKSLLNRLIGGEDIWGDLVRLDPGAEFDDVRDVYSELRRYLVNYSIRPRSIIHYRRSVFQENEEQLRITFDDELKIFRPPKGLYDAVPSLVEGDLGEPTRTIGKVILETKCQSGYPGWLRAALTHLLPRRISKFTTSMNLLHPREPSSGADPALAPANGRKLDGPGDGSRSPRETEREDTREQSVLR